MPASDIHQLLNALLAVLPLHAEEGGYREVVAEPALLAQMQKDRLDRVAAQTAVQMVRCLYEAMGLLEPGELARDRWTFVSFPASLLARSILETLATRGSAFFEPGYWIQGSHRPVEVLEEQRELLRRLESQRLHSLPARPPNPIRTVHVAWGIIRLGGRFLLRTREDVKRPEEKGYVFPGGRLDLTDLPAERQDPSALRDLFRVNSTLAKEALPTTLSRELREELGLLSTEYQAQFRRTLTPYTALAGTRNNLAFTQYDVALYAVQLTLAGELKVLDRVCREPDEWAWFTTTELTAGRRADAKSAFVDALSAEFGEETGRFLHEAVPDSSTTPPAFHAESDGLELPAKAGEPLLRGMTGREKPFSVAPNREEWELLMTLGWHARGLQVEVRGSPLKLLGASWIKLIDRVLLETAQLLAKRLKDAGFPILEVDSLGHCRIAIDPAQLYFGPDCFEYSWENEGSKKSILLTLREIDMRSATLLRGDLRIRLSPNFTRNLAATEAGKETRGDFERETRDHFEAAKALGLRRFVAATMKAYEILVPAAKP